MKCLPLSLNLEDSWKHIKDETRAFKRKYHTITIKYSITSDDNTKKFFRRHGAEVRCLKLVECNIGNNRFKLFLKMLRIMMHLEVLELYNCECDYVEEQQINNTKFVQLLHLKEIVLHDCDKAVS